MVTLITPDLCEVEDVRRIAGVNILEDISSEEIDAYITDATKEVLSDYGAPTKVTYATIESNTGSTLYDFTGDYAPVYLINRITIGGDFNQEVPTGSYTQYLDTGFVDIDLIYLQTKNGKNLKFEYVPELYHQLVANIAAADLLSNLTINSGEDTEVTKVVRISERIGKIRKELMPKGAYNASSLAGMDIRTQGYNFIDQNHWDDLY